MSRWLLVCSGLVALAASACGDNKTFPDGGMIDADLSDGGFVEFPADDDDYIPGIGSYVATLTVPSVAGDIPSCCYDFQAKSKNEGVDNGYAKFVQYVGGLVSNSLDVQSIIDDLLDDGDLIWLFDHRGIRIDRTDQFTLALLYGRFEGSTTVIEAQAGDGTFDIRRSSFVGGTGTPKSYFDGTTFNKSLSTVLTGARNIVVPFPVFGGFVEVPLRDARITGTATATRDGVTYTRGELSGYIVEDDFYAALNATLAAQCGCISGDLPIFSKSGDNWTSSCPNGNDVATACDADDERICIGIASSPANSGACSLWTFISANQLDIDSDGDSEYDAMSFGLEFTAEEAVLIDVVN